MSAAVGFYGGGITGLKDLTPKAPTLLHFREKDTHSPIAGVKEVAAAHPDVEIHIYPADHGFNCDQRESYDAPSAKLAWTLTLEFLRKHVGERRCSHQPQSLPACAGMKARANVLFVLPACKREGQ